tara:strand:+ start:662 stop:1618 length:957 start_codon:yes stop_codon:yes gene_type:complete
MKKIFLITLTLSILYSDYAGGYAGSSFRFGTNAREVSLSNSLVSNNNIGFNAFTNPSILAFNKGKYIGSSLFLLSNNRNIQTFTYSQSLPPSAAAAISFFRAGTSNIIGIDSNEYFTDELGYSDGYMMVSFGIAFNNYFSLGVSAKALLQSFNTVEEDYSSNGIGIDIASLISFQKLNIGFKVEVGRYNWNQEVDGENVQYEEIIPTRIISGISYFPFKSLLILFQHELMDVDIYNTHRSSFGLEYNIDESSIPIFIRLGLRQNEWIRSDSSPFINLDPSFGAGIQVILMNKFIMNIDYGLLLDKIGVSNLISVLIEL